MHAGLRNPLVVARLRDSLTISISATRIRDILHQHRAQLFLPVKELLMLAREFNVVILFLFRPFRAQLDRAIFLGAAML